MEIEFLPLAMLASEDDYCERNRWNGYQRVLANFFAREPAINVKVVAQCGCSHHGSDQEGEISES
jgi:hypothetical protein